MKEFIDREGLDFFSSFVINKLNFVVNIYNK